MNTAMPSSPTRVLFVCLGNICRSPLAEGIFLQQIEKLGMKNDFMADSAGTAGYHIGDDPDHRSVQTAFNHGIELRHKCRKFGIEDFDWFDYIVAMDQSNMEDILDVARARPEAIKKVIRMRDFDPIPENGNVPDPYYGGLDGFERVYQILDRSMNSFVEFLIRK